MEAQCRAAARLLVTCFTGDMLPMLPARGASPRRLTARELDALVTALGEADPDGMVLLHLCDLSGAIGASATPAARAAVIATASGSSGAGGGADGGARSTTTPSAVAPAPAPAPAATALEVMPVKGAIATPTPVAAVLEVMPVKGAIAVLAPAAAALEVMPARGSIAARAPADAALEVAPVKGAIAAPAPAAAAPASTTASAAGPPQVKGAAVLPTAKTDVVFGGKAAATTAALSSSLPASATVRPGARSPRDLRLSAKRAAYSSADLAHLLRGAIGSDLASASSLFLKFDLDSSGTLDFAEFANAVRHVLQQELKTQARARLRKATTHRRPRRRESRPPAAAIRASRRVVAPARRRDSRLPTPAIRAFRRIFASCGVWFAPRRRARHAVGGRPRALGVWCASTECARALALLARVFRVVVARRWPRVSFGVGIGRSFMTSTTRWTTRTMR